MSVDAAARPLVIALRRAGRASCAPCSPARGSTARRGRATSRPTCTTAPSGSSRRSTTALDAAGDRARPVFVAYADCGTGGALDALARRAARASRRLPGAHCYEFFAGAERVRRAARRRAGHLLPHRLPRQALRRARVAGARARPPSRAAATVYFGNYRRVVLLSQSDDPAVVDAGRAAAERLGLEFEHRHVGLGGRSPTPSRVGRRRGGCA